MPSFSACLPSPSHLRILSLFLLPLAAFATILGYSPFLSVFKFRKMTLDTIDAGKNDGAAGVDDDAGSKKGAAEIATETAVDPKLFIPANFPVLKNDLVLRAVRGEWTERTPVWIMRQVNGKR